MKYLGTKKRATIAIAAALAAAVGITGAVGATVVADSDEPITGPALATASAAALDHVGEGRVTDTEVDDEESHYEVEVTLESGDQIDVQLDESFVVVSSEIDDDTQDEPIDDD